MVIRAGDRVADVLRRDERMVEVFAAASPHFERLRNPAMRRVMARLVTVEQAARIARVDPATLLARLNAAAAEGGSAPPETLREESGMSAPRVSVPAALAALAPERVLDLDVRDDLRVGREPFSRIMAATRALPEGHALRLRAVFEPVPLYSVMARQGFSRWTEELAPDDWRVWFHRAPAAPEAAPPDLRPERSGEEGEGVVLLDVRGMEPPEPMVRTLAALEALPPGAMLLQINERIPHFLLPRLEELGFTYLVRERGDGLVRVFIRRRHDP